MQKKCEISAKFLVYFLVLAAVLVSVIAQLGQLGVPGENQQSVCGNNVCEDGETSRTCPHDCKERICPAVCVEMWQLTGSSCTFNSCGSGCGPDGTITFKDEVECRLRLAGPKCSDFSAEECTRHGNCQTVSVRKGRQRCIDFVKCAENEELCKQIDCSKLSNNKLECLVYDKCEYTGGKCVEKPICPIPECAAPPAGCSYEAEKDERGCPTCGKLVCEPVCGNGIIDPGEVCDGNNFGSIKGCTDYPTLIGGTLKCTPSCQIDTSGCVKAPACGDNICEKGEEECIGFTNSIPPSCIMKCPQDCQRECPPPPPCTIPLIYGDPKPGDPNQCPVYTCPSPVCGNGICEECEDTCCSNCDGEKCTAVCVGYCPQDCQQKCSQENEFCGGIAGITCCSGSACKLEGDYPDAGGTCVTEGVCPAIYKPVCGVDGNTYGNSCKAENAGVKVVCKGQCPCKSICGNSICEDEEIGICLQDCCPQLSPPLKKEGCTYTPKYNDDRCVIGYDERCTSPIPPRCSDLTVEECTKYEHCQVVTGRKQRQRCVGKIDDNDGE